ncbi:MAG: aldo/keto reductase [Gluconacetobacter diazotrophicus]|nr:aldo/keto reductase [Gluconacetobacter diazotrophicus]
MSLLDYRTLGRSGLVVSPLALGTMNFGAARWGTDEPNSRAVLDRYLDAGGNMLDTADIYSGGRSEEMLGRFLADPGLRDRVVLATKSGFPRSDTDVSAGGNGARNIRLSLEGSLRRLRTDHVDLYWIHVWDRTTPPEEVLRTLTDLVRAGRILHYGFSNAPAWYVTRIATLAQAHGLPVPIGLQYFYSLVDRGVELELVDAAAALGLGLVPWSPLAYGLLTGKYGREMLSRAGGPGSLPNRAASDDANEAAAGNASRDRLAGDNPFGGSLFTERNFALVDELRAVAAELGRTPAECAIAWVAQRPGVSTTLVAASRIEQLDRNLSALDIRFTPDQLDRLDRISAPPAPFPYAIAGLPRSRIFGGHDVRPWRP